ncbi:unnamed protein product [Microthlaspi erraticum]|uniref:Glycine-rich protein n=1 Tax=Microthlaspi erraticum TaxID=1685480 RepID=A0A6D2K3Y7_9BRAS|nr:unnamed protein product [Microthlaspi erraticum]
MNATKFVVLLFIGVVCTTANVGARKLEEVPKEAKLGISIPETATTNSVGTQLSVSIGNYVGGQGYSNSNADNGAGGASSSTSNAGSGYSSGYLLADGTNENAYLGASAGGQGNSNAEAGAGGAASGGYGSGYGSNYGGGQTTSP